jgi:hypothetical protein
MQRSEVLRLLAESEARLLEELERSRDIIHQAVPDGWTIAQIVHHLIRTEHYILPIWALVPKLAKWPALIDRLDRANAWMCRSFGMRTLEQAPENLTLDNAGSGRFRAPWFLDPRIRRVPLETLLEWRRSARTRSLRAIQSLDDSTLNRLRWSHPLLGSFTLMEFVKFLALHEAHHLPQIQRIRARNGGAGSNGTGQPNSPSRNVLLRPR